MFAAASMAMGLGVGAVAGMSVGPHIFKRIKPHNFSNLNEKVDLDETVPAPRNGLMVQPVMREALPFMEPWLSDPGYDRVAMINRLLAAVWPSMTQAVLNMVLYGDIYNQVLYPQLKKNVFEKFAFIEDILVGSYSLKNGRPNGEDWLRTKVFNLGTNAPKMGGFKIVPTSEDEVLLETCLLWGSDAVLDVAAVLRFGSLRLLIPVQLAQFNIKADVRVELRPLVDKIPILGGVTISLMRIPTVDAKLVLFKGIDIMALPLLPQIINLAMRVVLEPMCIPFTNKPLVPGIGMVHPNAMSFPIMPAFGIPPPLRGAIKVTVLRLEDVKGGNDLYCKLEVRRNRFQQTRTIANNTSPEFNEDFALIVDSFENDLLRIYVYNDDMTFSDTLLSTVVIPFGEAVGTKPDPSDPTKDIVDFQLAEFVRNPSGERVALPLQKVEKTSMMRMGSKAASKVFKSSKSLGSSAVSKLKLFKTKSGNTTTGLAPPAVGASGRSPSGDDFGGAPDLPHPGADRGMIHLKLQFVPFFEPQFDDEVREEQERLASGAKDPLMSKFPAPAGRAIGGGRSANLRGVLTVQLIRCIDLAPEGAKDLATYVRMLVTNDERDEAQTSVTILNETSPRWGDKFDFVLIPASSSELHLEVFNKTTGLLKNTVGSIFSSKKKEEKDTSMGKLLIPVKDVARNARLKDVWALQDTDRGHMELSLTWQTCFVSDM